MEMTQISNYKELQTTIAALKARKMTQEKELKITLKEVMKEFDHMSIVKSYLHEMAENRQVQSDMVKIGLHVGTNILINVVTNKFIQVKSFFVRLIGQNVFSLLSNISFSTIAAEFAATLGKNGENEADETYSRASEKTKSNGSLIDSPQDD